MDDKKQLLGANLDLWLAVLTAFRESRAKGYDWGRGDVARALHRLDLAARPPEGVDGRDRSKD